MNEIFICRYSGITVIEFWAGMVFEIFGINGQFKFNAHQFFKNKIANVLQPGRNGMGI